jgi:hypothetical protein
MRMAMRQGRVNACFILGIGAVLFLVDAVSILMSRRYHEFIWIFAPGCIALGVAGLIEPRIALAVSPEAGSLDLPRWARLLGPAIFFGGFAVGWWLMRRTFGE